jgi:hypothetical protein
MKKNYSLIFVMLFLVLIFSSTFVLAAELDEENEPQVLGFDLEGLITLGSSLLATVLFILTIIAYKRDGRKRLLYISIAFLLFAIKGVLISIDVFYPEKGGLIDPIANFLDFAILLSFFFGVVKTGG